MKGFLDPIDLGLNHVRVIVRGMAHVALSDGSHARELMLIQGFYESCRADITSGSFDADEARDVLDSDALKLTFLASCYLVAYADGDVSEGELKALSSLEKQLKIPSATVTQARELVKDQLLMQLSHSANLEALRGIAAKL
jgi:hypothetical protein